MKTPDVKWMDQWAVGPDPVLTSTTSVKIGNTAILFSYLSATSRRPCAFLQTKCSWGISPHRDLQPPTPTGTPGSAGGCWRSRPIGLGNSTVPSPIACASTYTEDFTLVSSVFVHEWFRPPRLAMGRWPMRLCRCRHRPGPPPAECRCKRRRRVHPIRASRVPCGRRRAAIGLRWSLISTTWRTPFFSPGASPAGSQCPWREAGNAGPEVVGRRCHSANVYALDCKAYRP